MEILKPGSFFDLSDISFADLFSDAEFVWEILDRIKDYVKQHMKPNVSELRREGDVLSKNHVIWNGRVITDDLKFQPGDASKGQFKVFHKGEPLEGATVIYAGASLMDDDIELGPGVVVEPGALIKGPTIIGEKTEVRQGAYVRGSCLVGRCCVVGHVTEMKNSVMLDNAKAGHFAYLGDSILGRGVNLGAGTKLANLKIVSRPVKIKVDDKIFTVERRKFGSIMGDGVETGCNTVTSPGAVLAPGCLVAPNMTVASGYYKRKSVIRQK